MQPIASGTTAAASAGGQGWPVSLRRYVERAFAQKVPDEKKGALNVALKQIISDAQASTRVPWMQCSLVCTFSMSSKDFHTSAAAKVVSFTCERLNLSLECTGKGGALDQELGDNATAPVAGGRCFGWVKACSRTYLMVGSAQGCQVLQPQCQTHTGDIKEN